MLYLSCRRKQVLSKKSELGVLLLHLAALWKAAILFEGRFLITLVAKQLRLEWVQEVTGSGLESRACDIIWLSVCHY